MIRIILPLVVASSFLPGVSKAEALPFCELVSALALESQQAPGYTPYHLKKIVRTGTNGYEELELALQFFAHPDCSNYLSWLEGRSLQPDQILKSVLGLSTVLPKSSLEMSERQSRIFRHVENLLKESVKKGGGRFDASLGPDTLFEELSPYRRLAKCAGGHIYHSLAMGQQQEAVKTLELFQGLNLHISSNATIGYLVAIAVNNILFASIESFVSELSIPAAQQLQQLSVEMMQETATIQRAVQAERKFANAPLTEQQIRDLVESIGHHDLSVPAQSEAEVVAVYKEYQRAQLNALEQVTARLSAPVNQWLNPLQVPDSSMAEVIKDITTLNQRILLIAAETRIRWHILNLYAKANIYRLHNKKWPQTFVEFAEAKDYTDPINGRSFEMITSPQGIEIFSSGHSVTGKIPLVRRGAARQEAPGIP